MKNVEVKHLGVSALGGVGLSLVVSVIMLSVGADILGRMSTNSAAAASGGFCANSTSCNATTGGGNAIQTLVNYLPIISIAIAAVVVLGLIMGAFAGMNK